MCAVGPEFATDRRQPSATRTLTSSISTSQYMLSSMMDQMTLGSRLNTQGHDITWEDWHLFILFFSSLLFCYLYLVCMTVIINI